MVAVAAAYLLVLQAIFAGLLSGAEAANFCLERTLAAAICAYGDDPPSGSTDHDPARHAGLSCCVLGSAVSDGAAPATMADFDVVVRHVVDRSAPSYLDAPSGLVIGRSHANPRAPPSKEF